MDVFPKFIIEGDSLIIGKVTYHKELATDVSNVRGGGVFDYDNDTHTFTLYGESSQFGGVSLEDIKECFAKGNVYQGRDRLGRMSDHKGVKFAYIERSGERVELSWPVQAEPDKSETDPDLADLVHHLTGSGYSEIYRTHPNFSRQEVHYIRSGVRVCVVTENERHFVYLRYTAWIGCGDAANELSKLPITVKTILVPVRAALEMILKYSEWLKNSLAFIASDPAYIVTDMTDEQLEWPEFPGEVNAYRTTREVACRMAGKGCRVYAAFDITTKLRDESGIEHQALDVKTKRPGLIRRIFGGK